MVRSLSDEGVGGDCIERKQDGVYDEKFVGLVAYSSFSLVGEECVERWERRVMKRGGLMPVLHLRYAGRERRRVGR